MTYDVTYDRFVISNYPLKVKDAAETLAAIESAANAARAERNRRERHEREADAAMLRLWHAEADAGMLDEFRAKHTPVVVSADLAGA